MIYVRLFTLKLNPILISSGLLSQYVNRSSSNIYEMGFFSPARLSIAAIFSLPCQMRISKYFFIFHILNKDFLTWILFINTSQS